LISGLALIADSASGLQIMDISVPGSAFIATAVDTPGTAYDVSIFNGNAFVADYDGGLRIIDLYN